jgi:hypothetical protein
MVKFVNSRHAAANKPRIVPHVNIAEIIIQLNDGRAMIIPEELGFKFFPVQREPIDFSVRINGGNDFKQVTKCLHNK